MGRQCVLPGVVRSEGGRATGRVSKWHSPRTLPRAIVAGEGSLCTHYLCSSEQPRPCPSGWGPGPRGLRGRGLHTLFFRPALPPCGSQSGRLGLLRDTRSTHERAVQPPPTPVWAAGGSAAPGAVTDVRRGLGASLPTLLSPTVGLRGTQLCPSWLPFVPVVVNNLLPVIKEAHECKLGKFRKLKDHG